MKLFEECREQEREEKEEEGKAGRFARKGKQEGQGGKVVAGGGCWVSCLHARCGAVKRSIKNCRKFSTIIWYNVTSF